MRSQRIKKTVHISDSRLCCEFVRTERHKRLALVPQWSEGFSLIHITFAVFFSVALVQGGRIRAINNRILEVYLCTLSKMPFGVLGDPKEEIF